MSLIYVVLFCVFVFLVFVFYCLRSENKSNQNTIQLNLTPFEFLQRQVYIKAISGDNNSRDWAMKYIFDKEVAKREKLRVTDNTNNRKKSHSDQAKAPKSQTSEAVVNEAISGLVSLGSKKTEAKKLVNSLIIKRKYNSCEELLKDVFKK